VSARSSKNGYTVIEVMVALSMLAVGATSVMALQKATFVNNTNAKNLVLANTIAATWAERLRTDALQWNEVGGAPDLTDDTQWLGAADTVPFPIKATPLPDAEFGTADFDLYGTDIYPGETATRAFCTHLRFTRFTDTNGARLWPNLIRAEIRVFWERNGGNVDCTVDSLDVDTDSSRYGAVYLTTSILQNTSIR
jgi:prepilin-type N-terminal cleavage/methylation domain-containing protein